MGLFVEEDMIWVRDVDDLQERIWKPLARVIGEWRMLANSVERSRRRIAVDKYPVLMSEISRYMSSLEDTVGCGRGEDYELYVKDCLRQVDEQRVTLVRILGSIRMHDA